jgi:hypothetical protein
MSDTPGTELLPQSTAVVPKGALFATLAGLAALIGLLQSRAASWVCDDAFISFRYAKNFADGHGLVFNVGERVEGYTNFLWTLLTAVAMKWKIDPVAFTIVTGIACFVITILLFSMLSWRIQRAQAGLAVFVPMTALALAVHHDAAVYATSGLETSFFTLLISLLYASIAFGTTDGSLIGAGVLTALAMLTRPDGIVFMVGTLVYLFFTRRRRIIAGALYSLPVILIYLPYWIWRFRYYGFPFPNTFYAKSADLQYYSQGLIYLWTYFQSYYALLLLPLLLCLWLWKYRKGMMSTMRTFPPLFESEKIAHRALLLAVIFTFLQIVYVVRVGGDFMFARFFIPITPPMLFAIELCSLVVFERRAVLVAGMVILGIFIRFDLFAAAPIDGYIADEPKFYPADRMSHERNVGEYLHNAIAGLPVKAAFAGTYAKTMYYMDPPIAIEMMTGLTDTAIAHQKLEQRGRPGHEKHATLEYLEKRGVDFMFNLDAGRQGAINQIEMVDIPVQILRYENSIMDHLAQYPAIQFVKVPALLDEYFTRVDTDRVEDLRADYQMIRHYYFECNQDTARERRFRDYIRRAEERKSLRQK